MSMWWLLYIVPALWVLWFATCTKVQGEPNIAVQLRQIWNGEDGNLPYLEIGSMILFSITWPLWAALLIIVGMFQEPIGKREQLDDR